MQSTIPANHAAQYVRMSTDHQRYSIDNQIDAIRDYAEMRDLVLVKTYSDPGRSGLHVKNRPGLQRLLADVESGNANYRAIIVYDVSRWGRFQDTDEGAYYEHLCRKNGVTVIYCSESFENYIDGLGGLIKELKRFMAAEYIRDLSQKVFYGQAHIADLGFHASGRPGFGFRRLAVTEAGRPRARMAPGEFKAIRTDRTVLVHGPENEVALVREMYARYLGGESFTAVAHTFNARGERTIAGGQWRPGAVKKILEAPRNVGQSVYGRISGKLGTPQVKNPRDQWHGAPGWEGIIPRASFDRVQAQIADRRSPRPLSDDELLVRLRDLLAREGRLSRALVESDERLPGAGVYRHRFGTLGEAFAAVGYHNQSPRDVDRGRVAAGLRDHVLRVILKRLREADHRPAIRHRRLTLYGFSYSVNSMRQDALETGRIWRCVHRTQGLPDLSVTLRLSRDGRSIQDLWLLPREMLTVGIDRAPCAKIWNTLERHADSQSAADALERLVRITQPSRGARQS